MTKTDNSKNCNFDDDDMNNDCEHCVYFLFPIGCMYYDEDVVKMRSENEKGN